MKTNWLKKKLAVILILAPSFYAQAQKQTVIPVTAKEAVDIAFKNAIDIKNVNLDYQSAVAKNKEYTSLALPQINLSGGMNHYFAQPSIDFANANYYLYNDLIKQGVKDGNGNTIGRPASASSPSLDFSFVYPWNMNYSVQLNQILFHPDIFIALKARKGLKTLASDNIRLTEEGVKLNVYKSYYAVLVAEKQLLFLNESIARLQKLLHDQNEIYKNGFAEKLDIDKTTVSLNNLTATSYQLKNGIAINYMVLKNTMGLKLTDSITLKDTLSEEMVKGDMLAITNFNYDERNEIKLLKKTSDLMKLDVRRHRLSKYPTLVLFGNYNSQAQRSKFDFFQDKKWNSWASIICPKMTSLASNNLGFFTSPCGSLV